MIKIRLQGTLDELDRFSEELHAKHDIKYISKPYKNRNSEHYRIYADVEPKAGGDVEDIFAGIEDPSDEEQMPDKDPYQGIRENPAGYWGYSESD